MKHLSSPTSFLHPADSPNLTSSFSFLKLGILKIIQSKMLKVLIGQEAIKTEWFFLQYLTYNIRLRQNLLSHDYNYKQKHLCRPNRKGTQYKVVEIQSNFFLARMLIHFYEKQKLQHTKTKKNQKTKTINKSFFRNGIMSVLGPESGYT